MPEYVKLPDEATFYYLDEETGECIPMESHADVAARGLFPVRHVNRAELEAYLATSEGEAEEE